MILKNKSLKLAKKVLFLVSLTFVINSILPHTIVYAKEVEFNYGRGPVTVLLKNYPNKQINTTESSYNQKNINSTLPQNKKLPYYETWITVTAYNSLPNQTDDNPFIAAWGDHVFWGMVASNCLPKNTKLQIPQFGEKMFTVLDRMNSRYCHRIDIWMPDYKKAKAWGVKYIKIKIYYPQ